MVAGDGLSAAAHRKPDEFTEWFNRKFPKKGGEEDVRVEDLRPST